jgi:hypothetical protein
MGPWKFHVFSGWNAPKVGDEIVLWSWRITKQRCAKQSAVSLLDGYSKRGSLASQLTHYRRFKVTYEELRHFKEMLSMIAVVNQRRPASLKL